MGAGAARPSAAATLGRAWPSGAGVARPSPAGVRPGAAWPSAPGVARPSRAGGRSERGVAVGAGRGGAAARVVVAARRVREGGVELRVVEPRLLERPAAAAVGEREPRRAPHVRRRHLVGAVERGEGGRRPRADDVGAVAVDAEPRARARDEQQHPVGEPHARQPRARRRHPRRERAVGVAPGGREGVRVAVEREPPPHDLDPRGRVGAAGHRRRRGRSGPAAAGAARPPRGSSSPRAGSGRRGRPTARRARRGCGRARPRRGSRRRGGRAGG